jgi:hypothetical protein
MEPLLRLLQAAPNPATPKASAPAKRPIVDPGHVHFYMIVIVWLALGTLGLWVMLFKQHRWANYAHAIFMGILVILTWMSGFIAYINFGFTNKIGRAHV